MGPRHWKLKDIGLGRKMKSQLSFIEEGIKMKKRKEKMESKLDDICKDSLFLMVNSSAMPGKVEFHDISR